MSDLHLSDHSKERKKYSLQVIQFEFKMKNYLRVNQVQQ